jgi:hypothetical protein
VLEPADRHHFVELPVHLAEVGLADRDPVGEPASRHLAAHPVALLGRGIQGDAVDAVPLDRVKHEPAEPRADVDDFLSRPQAELAADVLHLVRLGFLEGARALLPVRARVHHERCVEPQPVEVGTQPVVEPRVRLGLRDGAVREPELVPAVAHPDEGIAQRPHVEAGIRRCAERRGEAPFDVQIAGEVRLQEPDVAEKRDPPLGARRPDPDGHGRRSLEVLV